jgi:hypothetical protein
MSFVNKPQSPGSFDTSPNAVISDLGRSLSEVLESITVITDSLKEVIKVLSIVLNTGVVKDESLNQEIRRAQATVEEFRKKLEEVSRDQFRVSEKLEEQLIPNTISILEKMDEFAKDLSKYIIESNDKNWEKYQKISDSFSVSVAELKQVHKDIQSRSEDTIDVTNQLDVIMQIIKSCDASLHLLRQTTATQEFCSLGGSRMTALDRRVQDVEANVNKILEFMYFDKYMDKDGKYMSLIPMVKSWIIRSITMLFSKYALQLILFALLSLYLKGLADVADKKALAERLTTIEQRLLERTEKTTAEKAEMAAAIKLDIEKDSALLDKMSKTKKPKPENSENK